LNIQVDKLGDIVTRSSESPLEFEMHVDDSVMQYSFSKSAKTKISNIKFKDSESNGNSVE